MPVGIKELGPAWQRTGRAIVSGKIAITKTQRSHKDTKERGGGSRSSLGDTIGAFTVANLNDTDGDGVVDADDDQVVPLPGSPSPAPGTYEMDLMYLVIKPFSDPNNNGQKLALTVSGGARLFETSLKGQEIALTNGVVEFNLADIQPNGKTIWVEATNKSAVLRYISIQLQYRWAKDTVKATGIW